jgi:hypothetical protein
MNAVFLPLEGGDRPGRDHPSSQRTSRSDPLRLGGSFARYARKEEGQKLKKIAIVFLAVVFSAAGAAAQTAPTGKIVGKVKDADGGPLPGASVEATSPKLVGKASAVTDETGSFRLFSLPSGTYTVVFTLQNFKPVKRDGVVLQLEQTITLDITLEQGSLSEEVTVIGQSPLIDVKSTTKGATMTREVFMQLPRNRDFTGLLSTVPGVQYESNQGGLSVDGASGSENVWYIDGTNTSHLNSGLQAQSIVMEQVEEVKVTASGYAAEFGGSLGGVVNVISRSGGNEFHGDVFGYYNNNRLWMEGRSRDFLRTNPYDVYKWEYISNDTLYFDEGKDRDDTQRFEGVFSLGGYVFKDTLWFFGSFNPVHSRTYAMRWFTSDPVNLAAAKYPGDTARDPRQGRERFEFYSKSYYWNWQAKLTAQPMKGLRISLSAVNNFYKYRGSIPTVAGTATKNFPYRKDWTNTLLSGVDPGLDYPNWSANLTADYTVSNNFLVSLRGGYAMQDQRNQQIQNPGTVYSHGGTGSVYYPEIPTDLQRYSGWTNWSGSASATKSYLLERFSVNADFTYYLNLAGEHALKFGVQYIRLHEDVSTGYQHPVVSLVWGPNAFYTMPDGTKIQGKYGYYTVVGDFKSPYGNTWNASSNAWALYLQDSWTLGDKLTFNLGVRTESEYVPTFNNDKTLPGWKDKPIEFGFNDKIAPRLGAIYDVFGDSTLKVFASYGVYFDVVKLHMATGMTGGTKWWTSYYTLDNYDWTKIAASGELSNATDQAAGGTYMGSRNWRYVDFNMIDPGMKPMAQSELSMGAEKKLTEEISFSARLVYKHLFRTIEDVGVIVKDAQGFFSEAYFQANPGFGYTRPISQGGRMADEYWPTPKAKREYWGLNLSLEKRFANNWQGGINYTWSSTRGNYGGLASSDEGGRTSPNRDRYFDLWFERYDIRGNPLDGPLPSDRAHYFKVYGSYAFPFGLTVGVVAYGRSGFPRQTNIGFNDMTVYAEGYGDLGRLPFTAWADVYLEYSLRIAKKYTIGINAQINNITDTATIQAYNDRPNRTMMRATTTELLTRTYDWKANLPNYWPSESFGWWTSRLGPWTARLGARFSF